jgi:ribosomal-protein-alanine N-acetyltransferase
LATFLRSPPWSGGQLTLQADAIHLRPPVAGDWSQWAQVRAESRDFLVPWEPTWSHDELTRHAYRRRLRRYSKDIKDGTGYALFIFLNTDDQLLGGMTLTNIRRGVTQTGTLGYWMGEKYAGHGYMSRAVRRFLTFAFDELGLHRIEAACIPDNDASKGVLRNAGFQLEGHARKYLKIDGRWRDHLLFGVVADDPRADDAKTRRHFKLDI